MNGVGEAMTVIVGVVVTVFVLAWFTILPTLGLFYAFGWLK